MNSIIVGKYLLSSMWYNLMSIKHTVTSPHIK